MMKNKLSLVFGIAMLGLVGCDALDVLPELETQAPEVSVTPEDDGLSHYESNDTSSENVLGLESALVTRVIDGDTIELENGELVRFIGVDSPERGEPGFEEATEFTRAAVEGEIVWLESDGDDTDRFGRLRRYVWVALPTDIEDESQVKEKMLNAQLLVEGHAEVAIFGTPRLADFFRSLSN